MLIRSVATAEGRSRISRAPPEPCSAFCHLKMPAATLSKSFKDSQCGFVSIPTRILSIPCGPACLSNPRSMCDDRYRTGEHQFIKIHYSQFSHHERRNMTLESSLIDSALRNWRSHIERAG